VVVEMSGAAQAAETAPVGPPMHATHKEFSRHHTLSVFDRTLYTSV